MNSKETKRMKSFYFLANSKIHKVIFFYFFCFLLL